MDGDDGFEEKNGLTTFEWEKKSIINTWVMSLY